MNEDETWDALEELHSEGKIEVQPTEPDAEPAFSMTEKGVESARDQLRNNDTMVLFLVQHHLSETVERRNDESEIAQQLIELAEWLRDDTGVNLFRVMQRNADTISAINVDALGESFIQRFDPEDHHE